MFDSLNQFPIAGLTLSRLLASLFKPDQMWVLKNIETLSDGSNGVLGDLWRQTRTAFVPLSTLELCNALDSASQIVTLEIQLESDPSIELLIEDGIKVI